MLAKALTTFSIAAFLIAAVVVISGQKEAIENFVSPNQNVKEGSKKYKKTPIGKATGSQNFQELSQLMRTVEAETLGENKVESKAELIKAIQTDSPTYAIGSLEEGKTEVILERGGEVVYLCIENGGFTCAKFDLITRIISYNTSTTLEKAQASSTSEKGNVGSIEDATLDKAQDLLN